MRKPSKIMSTWTLVWMTPLFFMICLLRQGYAGEFTLRWNANNEFAAGYKIYYKIETCDPPYIFDAVDQGPSPITVPIGDLDDPAFPEFTLTGLKDGENYFFVVTAYFLWREIESGFSSEFSNSAASAPLIVGDPSINSTIPTWDWDSSGGGIGEFRIKLDDGDWVETDSASFTPDSDLTEGTHILYVQEKDVDGLWSGAGTFTIEIDLTPPDVPVVTGATPTHDTAPTWTWSSAEGGNGTFRYKLDDSDLTTGTTETTNTSYTSDTALSEGSYTLYVKERDEAGNWSDTGSWAVVIDITPPAAPNVSGTTPTVDSTPTWTWSSAGGGTGIFRYKIDDSDLTSGATITNDITYTVGAPLPEGHYTLYLQERDEAGNWSELSAFTIFVDLPPGPPVVSGLSFTNNSMPSWSWVSGGGGSGIFRLNMDSDDFSGGEIVTSDTSYTPAYDLEDGDHTLFVQEQDDTGNWSESGLFTINIDTAPPSTPTILGISPNGDPSPTWLWSSNGGGNCTFRFQLDNEDFSDEAPVTTATSYTPDSDLMEGEHTLYVQERDDAGNWSESGWFPILVDSTVPPLPSLNVNLAWDANTESHQEGYKIYYKMGSSGPPYDGTSADQGPSPIGVPIEDLNDPSLPDYRVTGLDAFQVYFIAVTAYNGEEFESDYSSELMLAPAVLTDIQSNNPSYTNQTDLYLTLPGVPCKVEEMIVAEDAAFSVNGPEWKPFVPESDFTLSDATEGERTVFTKFSDDDLNEFGFARGSITLDTTPPVTTAITPGGLFNGPQLVTLSCDDGEGGAGCAKTYYTTDGSEPTPQSNLFSEALNIDSPTTLKFFSTDLAGNDGAAVSENYGIDTTVPTGSMVINDNDVYTISPTATILLSAHDVNGIAQMMFSNDNAVWSEPETFAASKSWTTGSEDGLQTVYVKFKDNAGNWSTAYSDTIILDTMAPTATIDYSTTTPTTQVVVAAIALSDGTVTLSDGSVTSEGGNSHTFTENGSFTFEFKDALGNTGTAIATVDWIDRTAPSATLSYSTTGPTNSDVLASLVPSEAITVTNNGGLTSYIFTTSGSFTFEFSDPAGNTGTATPTVDWIDKTAPSATLSYSTMDPTYQDVVVTLEPSESVTITNNGGATTYTFTKNGGFTFEFSDPAGNTGTAAPRVDWIDKTAPTATLSYSTTDPTNSDVLASLVPSEAITVTNNGGATTYTFTENGSFTFEFMDPAGNTGPATATVDWIDKTAPTATLSYSATQSTNQDVMATLVASEPITVTNNGGSNSKIFTENGEFTFEFVDAAGNTGSAMAPVSWIDKTPPTAILSYSNTDPTNQDVVATLEPSESVTVTNNGGLTSYTFTANGSFTFELVDEAGNMVSFAAMVDWIDRTAPTATFSYSTIEPTNQDVVATLAASEPITVTNNSGMLTYTFTENGSFTFEFLDAAGNAGSATAQVTNIDKSDPTATFTYSTTEPTNVDVVVSLKPSEPLTVTNNNGIDYYTFTENGSFTFEFVDDVGNTGTAVAAVNWIDKTPPTSNATAPTQANNAFPIDWTASDGSGSGVASTELWYKKEASGAWQNSGLPIQPGEQGTFSYTPSEGDGTYYLATRSTDNAGNIEGEPEGSGDSSTIFDTVPTEMPEIVTDGGNGPGNDYSTTNPTIMLVGTCAADAFVIFVNGSSAGVTHVRGETSWSYSGPLQSGDNLFNIVAQDTTGNVSDADSITVSYGSPTGGYYNSNIIPSLLIGLSADGSGMVNIHFKIKDPTNDLCSLHAFQYSLDGGNNWASPINANSSEALSSGWQNNSDSGYASGYNFESAEEHIFTLNTKHQDLSGFDGIDHSDIRIRFTVNDGVYNSLSPVTSENFRVDNESPALLGHPIIDYDINTIELAYSEISMQNATVEANYSFSPSLNFTTETDNITNIDSTYSSEMAPIHLHTIYTLTLNNITDEAGNPLAPNTIKINDNDIDNMADDWEILHGVYDPNADLDEDGLSNLEEYNYGTNPNNPDTDMDELPDSWEVTYGLDPNDNTGINGKEGDFDNDGWTNYEEFTGGYNPADSSSPQPTSPVIVGALPHNNAGIDPDVTLVPDITSFAIRVEDSDGIDITDLTSIKFTVDDGRHSVYELDLSDSTVVRVVKLTSDSDTETTKLWAVYDRVNDLDGYYDYDTIIIIKVDVKDNRQDWMAQASYNFKIGTEEEHTMALVTRPLTGESTDGISTTLTIESTDALNGFQVLYNNNEPITPYFESSSELTSLDVSGVAPTGIPANIQPPTVFNNAAKLIIPYSGEQDARDLKLFIFNGVDWVYACSSFNTGGVVQPGGDGLIVPGSLVFHNGTSTPTLEVQVYGTVGIQGGHLEQKVNGEQPFDHLGKLGIFNKLRTSERKRPLMSNAKIQSSNSPCEIAFWKDMQILIP